jgi:hypothetical protein
MKKLILFLSALLLTISSFSQSTEEEFKPSGEVQFKVFWNYHYDFSQNATKKSAFEINRAYFGYKYDFSEALSAKITFDVGNNSGGSAYTAFLKIAQLDWKATDGIKLSMGLIGLKQFNDQEEIWGYRYIFESFQNKNDFGTSADLGIGAEFTITKTLKVNAMIVNGEGYKKLQDEDGNQKFAGSIIFEPINGLITKIYMDSQATTDSKAVTALGLFAGYKTVDWRLGAEYNKLNDGKKYSSPAVDHNLDGLSFYATYVINKKFEVFGRYDQLSSNTLTGGLTDWNIANDGSQVITGIQYAPVKGLKLSLNYQGFSFDDATLDTKSLVFLNAEFKL